MNTLMASARSLSERPRNLLLTFDAFGTLFYPRPPVPQQYAAVAHQFGLSRAAVTPQAIERAFGDVYRTHSKRWPNYGRADVLRGKHGGPQQWWEEVMRECFVRVLAPQGSHLTPEGLPQTPFELPQGMVDTLLHRFASDEGYALFDDVIPFFERMRELRRSSTRHFDRVVVGVVTNSDDRVPAVLKALGLRVGDLRADQDMSSMELPGFEQRTSSNDASSLGHLDNDLDFVITSYEAGEGKPNRLIFDIAKRQARLLASTYGPVQGSLTPDETDDWVCVHVGDEYEKDYRAAVDAGWKSYLVRADGEYPAKTLGSLLELILELKI
ncbi:unnamed protein product [Penicillium salamii]|nr:unnamed protein product [Penicillium salamii]CAG8345918.1 unnamed protein product [Penicillium salamii]CAG8370769.1 unnamed protein product [Penicillium salamii]